MKNMMQPNSSKLSVLTFLLLFTWENMLKNEGGITVLDPKKWSHRMTEKFLPTMVSQSKDWNQNNGPLVKKLEPLQKRRRKYMYEEGNSRIKSANDICPLRILLQEAEKTSLYLLSSTAIISIMFCLSQMKISQQKTKILITESGYANWSIWSQNAIELKYTTYKTFWIYFGCFANWILQLEAWNTQ